MDKALSALQPLQSEGELLPFDNQAALPIRLHRQITKYLKTVKNRKDQKES
jgi:hypothetical protein